MDGNVKINIKGLHENEDESSDVGTEVLGKYYLKNGKQYILYEEKSLEDGMVSKNTIKISEDTVEVIKKGYGDMHLTFTEGKVNNTYLSTIAGKIFVGVNTEKLVVLEEKNQIRVSIEYSLMMDEEKVSDCKVEIIVTSA